MRGLVACVLLSAVAGCGGPAAKASSSGSAYTLLQMNLCLSGLAGCYDHAVVDEAVARIRSVRPDAVTINEACRDDVARIARRTGLRLRFSRVIYDGAPLPCIRPGGRGAFGDAVLVRAAVAHVAERDFRAQADIERRRWLCVTTRDGIDVCTSHLADVRAANEAQCAELRSLLARRAGPLIFGGDVNRRSSCAPTGFWVRTDRAAAQAPGLQQAYGSRAFRAPTATVIPARHTDHDILLVRCARN